MKITLIRAARIRHEAGETVEVSPAEAGFLISTGSAVPAETPAMREMPEEAAERETRSATARRTRTKTK